MLAAKAIAASDLRSDPRARSREVERLYGRHKDQVYRLALRFAAGRRGWAEDVTQDVFLILFRDLDTLDARDDLGGWLYRVTTNACLKRLRRDRWLATISSLNPFSPSRGPEIERQVAARSELTRALEIVDGLPPKERVAFSMSYFDEKPLEEIAAVLGHSKGYVSKLLSRAELKVRQRSLRWR